MSLAAGTRLGPYEILAPIGAGGMGEVYRALDPRLGREVAIKVLPASVAGDASRLQRFEQEARAVAALSHPNILSIFDVGVGDHPYLVSELLDGETLRAAIHRGPLPVNHAIAIAVQVASGLAAASVRGIVHRDLKPENIFLTRDDVVKILDFGLAKAGPSPADADGAEGNAETAPPTTIATSTGMMLGTVGYMAPEQIRGLPVDHRGDIFALGAILSEMVTGQRAFHGPSPADTMAAVLRAEPADLTERPGTPIALARIVQRCLEKDRDNRFQSARDLRFALESISDRQPAAAPARADEKSIAVLPFANMSADPENEYFSDGLSEELINALTRLPGLRVAARTSAFRFRGRDLDIREIGRRLNVSTVLEGSVRRAGKHLRITAQLINAVDGYHLWSERYDRELDDVFEIQDEITASIVRTLEPTLLGHQMRLASRHSDNVRAFELYLKGNQLWHQRTPQSLRAAVVSFEQAIRLDPDYVLAHAGLAASYAIMAAYGFAPLAEARAAAEPAARRAITLNPQLAESHFAMALYTFVLTIKWPEAEAHYRKALEIQPREAMTQVYFGFFLTTRHRFDEGIAHIIEATTLDALSPFVHGLGSLSMYIARRNEEAIRLGERALELHPEFALASWSAALALGRLGQHERAIALLERTVALSGRAPVFVGFLGLGHAIAGHREEAAGLLEELRARSAHELVLPLAPLAIQVGLGNRDEICAALKTCLDQGYNGTSIEDTLGPHLDPLAAEPRIADLLDRLGLVPRTVRSGVWPASPSS